jgi:TonB family protein
MSEESAAQVEQEQIVEEKPAPVEQIEVPLPMAHLERRKRYSSGARSRGGRGIVYVRFIISNSGDVMSASPARSSGFSELDDEVLSLVRRASPVPAPPPGATGPSPRPCASAPDRARLTLRAAFEPERRTSSPTSKARGRDTRPDPIDTISNRSKNRSSSAIATSVLRGVDVSRRAVPGQMEGSEQRLARPREFQLCLNLLVGHQPRGNA